MALKFSAPNCYEVHVVREIEVYLQTQLNVLMYGVYWAKPPAVEEKLIMMTRPQNVVFSQNVCSPVITIIPSTTIGIDHPI